MENGKTVQSNRYVWFLLPVLPFSLTAQLTGVTEHWLAALVVCEHKTVRNPGWMGERRSNRHLSQHSCLSPAFASQREEPFQSWLIRDSVLSDPVSLLVFCLLSAKQQTSHSQLLCCAKGWLLDKSRITGKAWTICSWRKLEYALLPYWLVRWVQFLDLASSLREWTYCLMVLTRGKMSLYKIEGCTHWLTVCERASPTNPCIGDSSTKEPKLETCLVGQFFCHG